MIVNEIYEPDEPEMIEHMDIFREALLPYMSEDAIVNIEYIGNRYDVDISEGRFAGVSFLGYYYNDYISIELKSKQAFYKLFELFPQSTPIDYETLNKNLTRFKFLYAFAFGRNLNIKSIKNEDDLLNHHTYDGPNYYHLIKEPEMENSRFSVGMGIGIDTQPILLNNHISYNYSTEKDFSKDKNAIRKRHYKEFEDAFIEKFITNRLGISKADVTLAHYKVLRMVNI